MSFWKRFAASALESGARELEKQRNYAQKVLETKGDRLTDEQRQKVEAYAYTDHPERARDIANNLRDKE